jgi:small subunit ribosomal protein S1
MNHSELIPTDFEREPRRLAASDQDAPIGEPDNGQSSSASNEESFGDILSEFEESHRRASEGRAESRQGTVVAVSPEFVFVDIGFKTEGVIPAEEFRDDSGNVDIKRGDQLVVSIKGRGDDGYYLLSKIKVERPKDWSSLESAFAEKRTIAGVVTGVIKGGLSVDVGVRAFLPASRSGVRETADLEQMVGQEITCKIIKLDVADEDVVVDRRSVLEEEEAKARQQVFEALQEGAVVRGTVRTLTDFGAFIDLGGVDGLLHVTDISWGRVGKPADVLTAGESAEVKILKIDRQSRRISLGMKQLQPDPWSLAAEKYTVGERVRGKVTRVVDFGAFVELEPGVEGLIRLFDLTWSKKAVKPKDVVKPGELVEVVVLNVNGADRKIGLGLKQALGDPWDEALTKFPAGTIVEGKILNMANFGAFVELGEGVEGMIHVGDITAEKRIEHPQEILKTGQTVRAVVLEIDRERRRIRLGMKQLQPTSADEYIAEHKVGDIVTGRVIKAGKTSAEVELGEGVKASCALPKESGKPSEQAGPASTDVSSLSAMLAAKWKQGKTFNSESSGEPVRPGQVRSFRISALDPAQKRIELELA